MKKTTLVFTFIVLLFACKKEFPKWNLKKNITTPKISTNKVIQTTNISAQIEYEILSNGDASITQCGICWSTIQDPSLSDNHTTEVNEVGKYISSIMNLAPNTSYYARAYASNSVGTTYGNQINFTTTNSSNSIPTLTTASISSITNNSGISGGNIISDGGSNISQKGVCWGTMQNPTISDFTTNDGTGSGAYSSLLSNLNASTTYYVRAYATNNVGTSYGNEISFTSTSSNAALPILTTINISNITESSGTSGGNIISDGGSNISKRGICWSTAQNPTTSDYSTIEGSGTGSFSSALTGLTPSTTYYVKAYATNNMGTSYGNQISFTTSNISNSVPTVFTTSASSITSNSSVSGGLITSDGGATVTQRGVCWSTVQNPTIFDNTNNNGTGTGSYTSSITSLNSNTTYYVRAYATNSVGTSYGSQISFTTSMPAATFVGSNNCSSLSGVSSSFRYWNGTAYTNAPWSISNSGYSGSCWVAPDPNKTSTANGTHYVQFNRTFSKNGYIEFWVNTSNPGYDNLTPAIYVDGIAQSSPSMIGGQTSSFYFMQVKSSNISAGTHSIKIEFNGANYVFKIDEISFFEY